MMPEDIGVIGLLKFTSAGPVPYYGSDRTVTALLLKCLLGACSRTLNVDQCRPCTPKKYLPRSMLRNNSSSQLTFNLEIRNLSQKDLDLQFFRLLDGGPQAFHNSKITKIVLIV